MDQQDLPISLEDIQCAENFLAAGDLGTALPMLLELADAVQEYAEASCQPTEHVQYFSFANDFERLAYRRVENDPRQIVVVGAPFDRLYADLGLAYVYQQEFALARGALMQAVRWNPMECAHRLDLAEVYRALDDGAEWAALCASVVARASDARSLGLAYANLGWYFRDAGELLAAVACSRLAGRYAPHEQRAQQLADVLEREHPELSDEPDARAMAALEQAGVAAGANADIAICLVSCAMDAAAAGEVDEATNLTVRARDLVGQDACAALIKMVREADAERAEAAAKATGAEGE